MTGFALKNALGRFMNNRRVLSLSRDRRAWTAAAGAEAVKDQARRALDPLCTPVRQERT
jgi:hypothetical protein